MPARDSSRSPASSTPGRTRSRLASSWSTRLPRLRQAESAIRSNSPRATGSGRCFSAAQPSAYAE